MSSLAAYQIFKWLTDCVHSERLLYRNICVESAYKSIYYSLKSDNCYKYIVWLNNSIILDEITHSFNVTVMINILLHNKKLCELKTLSYLLAVFNISSLSLLLIDLLSAEYMRDFIIFFCTKKIYYYSLILLFAVLVTLFIFNFLIYLFIIKN